ATLDLLPGICSARNLSAQRCSVTLYLLPLNGEFSFHCILRCVATRKAHDGATSTFLVAAHVYEVTRKEISKAWASSTSRLSGKLRHRREACRVSRLCLSPPFRDLRRCPPFLRQRRVLLSQRKVTC